jgi:Predicted amidohydrolase
LEISFTADPTDETGLDIGSVMAALTWAPTLDLPRTGVGVVYNTVAMIDADGSVLGRYRKPHIPDRPGYSEKKYYGTPGDTGFRVWPRRYGTLGVRIC